MSHIPVNHHLRPLYRALAGLIGVFLLAFGAVGFARAGGSSWFAEGDWTALGLPTNRAFAVVSLLAGAVILGAVVVGRNVDRFVNLYGGIAFLVAGTVWMPLSHTGMNIFNVTVANTIVSYIIGTVLLAAGLYGKVSTERTGATA